MDYVTIAGELENRSNLFIRYIKSASIPIDEKISQVIKPMEPPNAIRGLSAACKYPFRFFSDKIFLSPSVCEISTSKHPGICLCSLSTSIIG